MTDRIDLTQFIGHTDGPWRSCPYTMYILASEIGGCNMDLHEDFVVAQPRGWGCLSYHGNDYAIAKQKANSKLAAAAPSLLAEALLLKSEVEDAQDNYDGAMSDIDGLVEAVLKGSGLRHIELNYPDKFKYYKD